eukprot:4709110-Amphidinium_carterae.1
MRHFSHGRCHGTVKAAATSWALGHASTTLATTTRHAARLAHSAGTKLLRSGHDTKATHIALVRF